MAAILTPNSHTLTLFDLPVDEQPLREPGFARATAAQQLARAPLASHANLAETILASPSALAPWNRVSSTTRPAAQRHLHLVVPAFHPVQPRRPVRSIVGGVILAFLLALAAVGALQFFGANAAASTPALTTEHTDPTGAGVAAASAPVAVQVAQPALPAEVVVKSGESIWAVARRLQPQGDVRHLVDALIERAGGASVVAGQHINVSGLLN